MASEFRSLLCFHNTHYQGFSLALKKKKMLREKETEIDGSLHPNLSGLSREAQLEVLVLFQFDENSTVNSGAYSSQRKTVFSLEDWKHSQH